MEEKSIIEVTNDPRWCTYQQAQSKGWKIKRGSKGTKITFWKKIKIADNSPEEQIENTKIIPVVKFFTVFHASQIDGIEQFSPTPFNNVIDNQEAEKIILDSGAQIRHSGFSAFYSPQDDFIRFHTSPPKKTFHRHNKLLRRDIS